MALTRIGLNQSINLASNVTGTLPTGNGGTGATSFAPGKVLQVQHQEITTTVETTSDSFVDTGFSLAITPASTSSKILCVVNLQSLGKANSNTSALSVRIVRTSTDIGRTTNMMYQYDNASTYQTASIVKLDSPSTNSATTYKVTFKNRETNAVHFNAYTGDTSTFTLYEIGA
jgi:hypothetical protein